MASWGSTLWGLEFEKLRTISQHRTCGLNFGERLNCSEQIPKILQTIRLSVRVSKKRLLLNSKNWRGK